MAILVISLFALFGSWCWIEFAAAAPLNLSACFSVRFLGKPCPMCGLTRGLHAVWQGDFAAARVLHPLSLAAFVLLVAETFSRLALLLARCTSDRWKDIARGDMLIHAALASAYCGYAIAWTLHRYLA